MNKKITFRSMDPQVNLEDHVNKELSKLDRILQGERTPIYLETTIESERNGVIYRVETLLKTPHYDLVAHYECPDVYEAINKTADKLNTELHKAKEKRIALEKTGAFNRPG